MPEPIKFTVFVTRFTKNILNDEKLRQQIVEIANVAKRNQSYKFQTYLTNNGIVSEDLENDPNGNNYKYTAKIVIYRDDYLNPGAVYENWTKVLDSIKTFAEPKWTVTTDKPHETIKPIKETKKVVSNTDINLPPLTKNVYEVFFGRLYNREPQIRIIYDSASTAVRTKFKERHHVLLRGPAGTAKTELFEAFCEFIGSKNVWHVDATTLSKAGLERELIRRSREGTLAPFLYMEEIEKVISPQNLNCLLQVMDMRGKIQRTNARDGDIYEECKVVVWGTCNDSKLLKTFADGALWSRFSLRPICKRPDRILMRKILIRSVNEVGGKVEWVDPVIKFMWEELQPLKEYKEDYNDPRLGRALLTGGERLLDNGKEGFFADFLACCEGKESGEEKVNDDLD